MPKTGPDVPPGQFQYTPACAGDDGIENAGWGVHVSIHARVCGRPRPSRCAWHPPVRFNTRPRVRATRPAGACRRADGCFNTRPRVRATSGSRSRGRCRSGFNTRPRVRATCGTCRALRRRGVSIHARVCGRRGLRHGMGAHRHVSIHARVCGRRQGAAKPEHRMLFQYTPACAGDTFAFTSRSRSSMFQYTPACAGDLGSLGFCRYANENLNPPYGVYFTIFCL